MNGYDCKRLADTVLLMFADYVKYDIIDLPWDFQW